MMFVCVLDERGEIGLERNTLADPKSFIKAVEPYRDDLDVAPLLPFKLLRHSLQICSKDVYVRVVRPCSFNRPLVTPLRVSEPTRRTVAVAEAVVRIRLIWVRLHIHLEYSDGFGNPPLLQETIAEYV